MNDSSPTTGNDAPFLRGLSIQQRLPLLICVLLLCVIVAFSWTSYYGVKTAAREMSRERLRTLTDQLSSMLGQSAQIIAVQTNTAAAQPPFKNMLLSGNASLDTAALRLLDKLRTDSTWVQAGLYNNLKQPMLQSMQNGLNLSFPTSTIIDKLSVAPDSCRIGNLYQSGDSIFYPVVAAVSHERKTIGYLVRWRIQKTTPRALAQFSQLLGDNASLYIANADGSLWTDLNKVVESPPAVEKEKDGLFEYARSDTGQVLATAQRIGGTPWLMHIELSQGRILEAGTRYFHWVLIVGSIILAAGILFAWLISRKIIAPLNKLTAAAASITRGDYSVSVDTQRRDELGQLATAFNIMAVEVKNAKSNLEQKVMERTAQYEETNKELESFSYSVSHDLRAPLRIINGYTEIVRTDYSEKLDDEGRKMLGIITANAKKMGRLIDDLLNLSRMGRKELVMNQVNMKKLAESVIHEPGMIKEQTALIKIADLHTVECDSNLIRQVWINLLSNAVKYSAKKEQPVIEISSVKTGQEIIYSVKDNGVGFDMQYADKLFGVFQRMHKASDYEGTGVGLALVQRIIAKHGGRVWAEAAVDKGATFYFTIPLVSKTYQFKFEKAETA